MNLYYKTTKNSKSVSVKCAMLKGLKLIHGFRFLSLLLFKISIQIIVSPLFNTG